MDDPDKGARTACKVQLQVSALAKAAPAQVRLPAFDLKHETNEQLVARLSALLKSWGVVAAPDEQAMAGVEMTSRDRRAVAAVNRTAQRRAEWALRAEQREMEAARRLEPDDDDEEGVRKRRPRERPPRPGPFLPLRIGSAS